MTPQSTKRSRVLSLFSTARQGIKDQIGTCCLNHTTRCHENYVLKCKRHFLKISRFPHSPRNKKRKLYRGLFVNSISWDSNFKLTVVDANGNSGGLLCIWSPEAFTMMDTCCNRRFHLYKRYSQNQFLVQYYKCLWRQWCSRQKACVGSAI